MKKTILAILVCISQSAASRTALAQSDEAKPTPAAPYIIPVPEYGHWIVTFKYGTNSAPAPAVAAAPSTNNAAASAPDDSAPTSIDTIKTMDLRGVVLTFPSGTTKQYTCQGDWILTSTPNGPQLGIASSLAHPYMYYTRGFILLDGVKIDSSTFRETAKHNGALAFHYKSGEVEVWIDPASMRPLTVKQPGVEANFQFLNPPPRPFPIPQDQEKLLQAEQKAYSATRSMR